MILGTNGAALFGFALVDENNADWVLWLIIIGWVLVSVLVGISVYRAYARAHEHREQALQTRGEREITRSHPDGPYD